jgi:DNA replication and repair protein RecF
VRVNGIPRRVVELVGQVNVVMFSAEDIELIGGTPSHRRRYLDVANSQVDPRYLHTLQRYQRVLERRNHLLRAIQNHHAQPGQLDFWDQELVGNGSQLVVARYHLVEALGYLAHSVHRELTSNQEDLEIVYHPSVGGESLVDGCQPEEIAGLFQQALSRTRERELLLGMTLTGPHRDDIRFLVDKVDMGVYGSRGQQRTTALSLKLAEARFMLKQVDDHPILLLDDILSELDPRRRQGLLQSVADGQQVLITTTDLDRFQPEFLSRAALFEVKKGLVQRLEG